MAVKRRPPQHRVDAPMIYVHEDDDAWDTDRVVDEQKRMKEAGEKPTSHPVAQYHDGLTRYDLDARGTVLGQSVTVRDYLNDDKKPLRWHLRRLSIAEWYEVEPLVMRALAAGEGPYAGYLRAFMLGVSKVDNGPDLDMPGGRLSMADAEKIRELADGTGVAFESPAIDLPFWVGRAAYKASAPLTDIEKKASG